MGLEFINQPQVFTQPITALGGIQGSSENYPLLTQYHTWITVPNTNTTTVSVPLSVGVLLNESASFIVTVGGVIQPPTTYTVDVINRLLIFTTPLSANIEIVATQLATASPSSQSFNSIFSDSGNITTLSCVSAKIEDLTVGSSFEPPNLYLPAPGELGIGLDSVGTLTKFHIKAAESDQIMITNNTTPASSWRVNVSDSNGGFYLFDYDFNRIPLRVEKNTATNTLYLNLTGVGINTVSPNHALTVVGNISATNTIECSSVRTVSLTGVNAYFTGTNVGIGTNTPITIFETRGGTSTFTTNGNERSIAARYSASGNPVYFGASNDTATPNAVISNTSNTALATFAHGGSVGIGTTTPNANFRLTVADGKGSGSSNFNTQFTSGNYWLGVNTRSDAGSWNPLVQSNDTTLIFTQGTVDTGGLVIGQHSTSTRGLRIAPTGNIGIATANPNKTLTVAGEISATSLISSPFTDTYLTLNAGGPILTRYGGGGSAFGPLSALSQSLVATLEPNALYEIDFKILYLGKYIISAATDIDVGFALSASNSFDANTVYSTLDHYNINGSNVSTLLNRVLVSNAAASTLEFEFLNSIDTGTSPAFKVNIATINAVIRGPVAGATTICLAGKVRTESSNAAHGASIELLAGSYIKYKKLPTV